MSVKTITTVREYDEQGRVVKETVTEIVHTAPSPYVDNPGDYWWRPAPYPYPRTWPIITVSSTTTAPELTA